MLRLRSRPRGGRLWHISVAAAAALITVAGPVASEARSAGRHAAMVVDANTGRVLHAEAADEPRYPASLTKIMTLYMVFELLEQGRLKPDTRIKISRAAAGVQPSKLDLDPGDDIALMDAVKALVTKSANDIAVAIAEHIGGTEANFARMMTERARSIGMSATTFRNAHGLTDAGQITTARDMLKLSLRLMDDFPQYYGLFATRRFTYNGSIYRNHNSLLGSLEGTDGIKTGYTSQSGFNLVASVRRDGRHVVGVVFGGASAGSRNAYMRQILLRAFTRASTERTRQPAAVAAGPSSPRRGSRVPPASARAPVAPPLPRLVTGPMPVASVDDGHMPDAMSARRAPEMSARHAPEPVVEAAAVPRRAPPIVIAPVRPVFVGPGAHPPSSERTARYESPPAAAPAPEVMAPLPPRPASPSMRSRAPVLAPLPSAHAPSSPPAIAVTSDPSRDRVGASPAWGAPPRAPTGPVLGAPPSTLRDQAERLGRGAPSYGGYRPAPVDTAPPSRHAGSGAGAAIQVGAFSNEGEARRHLDAVRTRSAGLLDRYRPATEPMMSSGRQLYRARFTGLDETSAATACLELRRQQIDCFVMRAQ